MNEGVIPESPDVLHPSAAAVLAAVLVDRHPTYGTIIGRVGLARSTVASHLRTLRRLGLVSWEDERRGTIRARVVPVKVGK